MGMKIDVISLETILHYLRKFKICIPYYPTFLYSGYTQEKLLYMNTRRVFLGARFVLAKTCQQSNCTPTRTAMVYIVTHSRILYSINERQQYK